MPAYYKRLAVIRIDALGVRTPLTLATINIYNVTSSTSLGTVSTDEWGFIAEGSIGGAAGDIIEFSSSYPLKIRQTLANSQAEAYTLTDNSQSTYIVENLYTSTTDATTADLLAQDLDSPLTKPYVLASLQPGTTNSIPIQSGVNKNLRLSIVSKTTSGNQSAFDLNDAPSRDVSIPSLGNQPALEFENLTDAPTTGTGKQILYIDTIDAGTFSRNGDTLEAEYTIVYAANGNSKSVIMEVAGTELTSLTTTENGTNGDIEMEAMRVDNTKLRVATVLIAGSAGARPPLYTEITGLDLDNTDYTIVLKGLTPTTAGDVKAVMGRGKFWQGTGNLILTDETGLIDLTDEAVTTITA